MGFIAMKGLAGGLLNNAKACMNFIKQYDNVVPIWGIQTEEELDEWLALESAGDFAITDEIKACYRARPQGALRQLLPQLRILPAPPRPG